MLTHFLEPSLTPSCHGNNAVWNDVNDHAILHLHLKCCYELHRTHFCVCVAPFTHPRFYFCSNKSLCVIIMHNLKKSKHDIVNTLLFLLKRDHTALYVLGHIFDCTGFHVLVWVFFCNTCRIHPHWNGKSTIFESWKVSHSVFFSPRRPQSQKDHKMATVLHPNNMEAH